MILEWLASGGGVADIVKVYPQLASVDVEQAIRYAGLVNNVVLTDGLQVA
jgi:uncharacterized protein (DUF433 family)